MKTVKHIVIPYKFFNLYDLLSLNISLYMWKKHYSEKAQLYIIGDKATGELINRNPLVNKKGLKFIEYNNSVMKIHKKYPKGSKTFLLNSEIILLNDLFKGEDFIFASDDRFPIYDIDDSYLNIQHKLLGKYPKWNVRVSKNNHWKWLMEKGAEFMKTEYGIREPILFKNHYFTKYTNDFISWFKPYQFRFDLAQMLTYYRLYVKKEVNLKDIYKPEMIITTKEFGKDNHIDFNKRGKTLFGLSVSNPEHNLPLFKKLIEIEEIDGKNRITLDSLIKLIEKGVK